MYYQINIKVKINIINQVVFVGDLMLEKERERSQLETMPDKGEGKKS